MNTIKISALLIASAMALSACGDKSNEGGATEASKVASVETAVGCNLVSTIDGSPLNIKVAAGDSDAAKEFLKTCKNPYNEIFASDPEKLKKLGGQSIWDNQWVYPQNATDKGMFETIAGGTPGKSEKGTMFKWHKQLPGHTGDGLTTDEILQAIAYIRTKYEGTDGKTWLELYNGKHMTTEKLHHIVIVGGGAGGLELATRLGDSLGKKKKALITLVDSSRTHVWKPLLHEIAAGSMDPEKHELNYLAQAHWHHFKFRLGRMNGLNRDKKEVLLEAFHDEDGFEVIPARGIPYDTLVVAIGSTTNDFGVKGALEHSIALDTQAQAERFHRKLHNALVRAQTQTAPLEEGQLNVAIVGAGATGVELAAELHNTTRELAAYGLDNIDAEKDVKISIVEASDRLLPALPAKLSASVEVELRKLEVEINTGERVTEVSAKGIKTHSGRFIPSALVVWAAGIKAPDFLKNIDGLETNSINQLVVEQTLQTTLDENIFAFGDCAACEWVGTYH
ncbi:NADH dehydrogenase [Nymphon striatum]|nr:NADH dehydrogenase [Nymphon striatum]